MEPDIPLRMHGKAARRKVQVVYYLHRRGGHIEHPHLLEGFLLPAQDGFRLKDFKNWLSALRGNGMVDSFSWSYKRSYKAGYIWQDLSGDDLILPLQKNEYVLMGFELQSQGPLLCKCGQYSPEVCVESAKMGRRQSSKEEFKLHELLKEGIMEYIHVSNSKTSPRKATQGMINDAKSVGEHMISACPSFKAENLQTSLTGFSDCDDSQLYEVESLISTKPVMANHVGSRLSIIPSPLLRKQGIGEVKVYKAKEAEQTTDAATQTGESKRCSTEEALNTPFNVAHPRMVQHQLATSLLLVNGHQRSSSRSSSLPLFMPADNQFHNMRHDSLLLKGNVHSTMSHHGMNDTEQDSYISGHNNSMLSVSGTASNKSEMFYSPSSVHSSCTVLETVSPGSARSLRSVNSMNSTRFSSTVDDHIFSSNGANNNAGVSPPAKAKLSSSTHLLKQFLSCGSVDINDSSMLNLKAMSLRNTPTSTPLSNGGMPTTDTSHDRCLYKKSQSPHLLHQQCEDVSPPTTPKSWLCRPCGGHSSCFTTLEVHSSPHHIPPPLSRDGSLKDIDVLEVVNGSLNSAASKKSPSLVPPPINLNYSDSPKTRSSVGDSNLVGVNTRDPGTVRRSASGGSRDLGSALNWGHTTPHNLDHADAFLKKGAAVMKELSVDATTPHKASNLIINKKMINSFLRRSLPAHSTTSSRLSAVVSPPRSGYLSNSHTAVACCTSPSAHQDSCQCQLHYFNDSKCCPRHHQAAASSLYELVKSGSKGAADIIS